MGKRPGWSLIVVAGLLAGGVSSWGQGTFTILQTGSGQPLVSEQVVLALDGTTVPVLQFNVGFATDELPSPGQFFDSLNVTVQSLISTSTVVVVTLDASGALWTPSSPGAVPLADGQVLRQAIAPPQGSPILGQGMAYAVQVLLPAALTGPTIAVDFDLFDNQNSVNSLGWFSDVQLAAVPEPSVMWLFALGFGAAAWTRSRRK